VRCCCKNSQLLKKGGERRRTGKVTRTGLEEPSLFQEEGLRNREGKGKDHGIMGREALPEKGQISC